MLVADAEGVTASVTPSTETTACAKPFFSLAEEELAGTLEERRPIICSRSCSCSARASPVSGGGVGGGGRGGVPPSAAS